MLEATTFYNRSCICFVSRLIIEVVILLGVRLLQQITCTSPQHIVSYCEERRLSGVSPCNWQRSQRKRTLVRHLRDDGRHTRRRLRRQEGSSQVSESYHSMLGRQIHAAIELIKCARSFAPADRSGSAASAVWDMQLGQFLQRPLKRAGVASQPSAPAAAPAYASACRCMRRPSAAAPPAVHTGVRW